MLSYILTAIVAIFFWEIIKDMFNIRNIFDKYDGLSTEETLAVKRAEEKNLAKKRKLEKKKNIGDLIDD